MSFIRYQVTLPYRGALLALHMTVPTLRQRVVATRQCNTIDGPLVLGALPVLLIGV